MEPAIVNVAMVVVGMVRTRLQTSNLMKKVDVVKLEDVMLMDAVELLGVAMMMLAVNAKKPVNAIPDAENLLKVENVTKRAREKKISMWVPRGVLVWRIMSKFVGKYLSALSCGTNINGYISISIHKRTNRCVHEVQCLKGKVNLRQLPAQLPNSFSSIGKSCMNIVKQTIKGDFGRRVFRVLRATDLKDHRLSRFEEDCIFSECDTERLDAVGSTKLAWT